MSNVDDDCVHHLIGAGLAISVGLSQRGLTQLQIARLGRTDAATLLVLEVMRSPDADSAEAWNAMLNALVAIAGATEVDCAGAEA